MTCNELIKQLRGYLKSYPKKEYETGIPIKVRKYNEKHIEILCYGNLLKREFAVKTLLEYFPVEERKDLSQLNIYYVENINVSII